MVQALKSTLKSWLFNNESPLTPKIPETTKRFFVTGASRSGTTYLHALLGNHPDIFMPKDKELHYFDKDSRYDSGLMGYNALFNGYGRQEYIGEITPFYMYADMVYQKDKRFPQYVPGESSIKRIHKHFPDSKIIITLRDPFERLLSIYKKNVLQGKYCFSLSETLQSELELGPSKAFPKLLYLNRYDIHLENIYKYFSKDQVCILFFEEWVQQPLETLNKIVSFLELPPYSGQLDIPEYFVNAGTKYEKKDDQEIVQPDINVDDKLYNEAMAYLEPAYQCVENLMSDQSLWKYGHFNALGRK
ncbi:MAG: sulfotransferase [Alphaproteobacteria bacterium]|nr:sulfotransferase [Alphaproteobacteria bacterium]